MKEKSMEKKNEKGKIDKVNERKTVASEQTSAAPAALPAKPHSYISEHVNVCICINNPYLYACIPSANAVVYCLG